MPGRPAGRRRTNSLEITQSPLRWSSIATSSMLATPDPSRNSTVRSSSSPTARVSNARCSNRRMFTRPVEMTCPESIDVTRVRGRNTRRRLPTSTTSPTARGAPLRRTSTTTSRTRPTWSPRGSNTLVPARRATKTLVPTLLTPVSLDRSHGIDLTPTPGVPRTVTGWSLELRWGEDGGMSFSGSNRPPGVPTQPQGETVAAYDTYLQAQRAVAHLADKDFPVQLVTIVGTDLRMVERVTGRLSYPRAALGGFLTGAWLGLFVGLLLTLFSTDGSSTPMLSAIVIGGAFGMLFSVVTYAATRRRRDFTSTSQIVASSYAVLCRGEQANKARNLLHEIGGVQSGWPAQPVTTTSPAGPPAPYPPASEAPGTVPGLNEPPSAPPAPPNGQPSPPPGP